MLQLLILKPLRTYSSTFAACSFMFVGWFVCLFVSLSVCLFHCLFVCFLTIIGVSSIHVCLHELPVCRCASTCPGPSGEGFVHCDVFLFTIHACARRGAPIVFKRFASNSRYCKGRQGIIIGRTMCQFRWQVGERTGAWFPFPFHRGSGLTGLAITWSRRISQVLLTTWFRRA